MNITIPISVGRSVQEVWEGFNENLFLALNPPFPPAKLLRFDGSMKHDEIHIELNFIFFKQTWISTITDQMASPNEIYFVDEGKKLPFFLRYWRHKHRIVKNGNGATIIEEITYKTPSLITDYLLYPLMYLQFIYRKPIYQKIFKI